jgi:hypothetical protein
VSAQPNPPAKHHFVPIFYLKQWAGSDGRLCEFSKPRPGSNLVKPKMTHPSGTGYTRNLYALPDRTGTRAQVIEELFMKPVDTAAADVMAAFNAGTRFTFNHREMLGWTRFLMSLQLRHPDDLEAFQRHFAKRWGDISSADERAYARRRKKGMPSSLSGIINQLSEKEIETQGMGVLVDLIENPRIIQKISEMRWRGLFMPFNTPALLTSDRPLIMTDSLANQDSYILMPIGPKVLFSAVNTPEMTAKILQADPDKLVEKVNLKVVTQASRYVFAMSDRHRSFVQRWMSSERQASLADIIARGMN